MPKKKTTLTIAIENIDIHIKVHENTSIGEGLTIYRGVLMKLLPIEAEQIKDAWASGRENPHRYGQDDYFTETFETK